MSGDPKASGPGSGPRGEKLPRSLGLLDAVGIGFGAIVGAGIFVVTGVAAGIAGPAMVLGLALAAIPATANALSSAELAAAYPESGGTYEYGYRVLTPTVGFVAGWMFLASKIAAAGTVALGLAGYLEWILPGLPPRLVAFGFVVLLTALNLFGVKRTSRVNLLIVFVSVGALLLFSLVGAFSFDPARLRPFLPESPSAVLQAAAILFFAYTGYARIATLGEEVREPRTTIPRAIILTLAGAVVLYGAVALVAVGSVGASALADSAAPLQVAAEAAGGRVLAGVVSVGGIAAMLGVTLSQILSLSRMSFAMARRGDLPRALGHVHPERGIPDRAVILVGVIAAALVAAGTLQGLAAAASFCILVYYGIANVAALRLPSDFRLYPQVVPIVGLVTCGILALSLPVRTMATGALILAVGFAVRKVVRRIAK